ncbi:sugar phosphate isomerase/epimerase [Alicyclobacillus fastidiosus]|uniref:Sugar phosphate isomerase/epimerase n=1 Tax=Alicyclobacillus fastidiosus TaxID=392011 RepID=A0ABY6ZKR6_9BACL|nr:sugar phosphate isomerase/epimerase [Alicyclobacillus fastidiosus]WAH42689.1 sugar phosphate isomerase/epimerase [Alicyclobacillus fastidiosus]GMA64575.1 xylose isomerase [Alicyclobacillus fastidiosus]
MKLGVFTVLFQNLAFEDMLDTVKAHGLDAVELGTGNFPGSAHCDPDLLLHDNAKLQAFQRALESRGLVISALSCHGNPLHPNRSEAEESHSTWRKTVELAERLGIDTVNVFSGCPGDSEASLYPNWVTCAWPPDYQEILNWQWNEKLIPYWNAESSFANKHGVTKIAFEMHPGFMLYNPETLLRLREVVGVQIGANFDPSHLVWQGVDPVSAIQLLAKHDAIFHVHAKDVYLDENSVRVNGVLDTKPYQDILHRSWTFRSVGYGLSESKWREIVSTLRAVGYDGVISIEHEDALASPQEGFRKAVDVLQRSIFRDPIGEMWWA